MYKQLGVAFGAQATNSYLAYNLKDKKKMIFDFQKVVYFSPFLRCLRGIILKGS